MKLEPFGERLIVKRLIEEQRSGIVLPKQAQERSFVGKVLEAGPDAIFAKEGDVILFAQYSGKLLEIDGKFLRREEYEDCLVMNEADILGRLTEQEAANGNG